VGRGWKKWGWDGAMFATCIVTCQPCKTSLPASPPPTHMLNKSAPHHPPTHSPTHPPTRPVPQKDIILHDNDADIVLLDPDWDALLPKLRASLPGCRVFFVVPSEDRSIRWIRVLSGVGVMDLVRRGGGGEGSKGHEKAWGECRGRGGRVQVGRGGGGGGRGEQGGMGKGEGCKEGRGRGPEDPRAWAG
jgi:hypothetical protein